jgi:hypothetical protein
VHWPQLPGQYRLQRDGHAVCRNLPAACCAVGPLRGVPSVCAGPGNADLLHHVCNLHRVSTDAVPVAQALHWAEPSSALSSFCVCCPTSYHLLPTYVVATIALVSIAVHCGLTSSLHVRDVGLVLRWSSTSPAFSADTTRHPFVTFAVAQRKLNSTMTDVDNIPSASDCRVVVVSDLPVPCWHLCDARRRHGVHAMSSRVRCPCSIWGCHLW